MKNLFSLLLLCCITIFSFAQDKIYKGTKVSILEIEKADNYYDERVDFLGKNATALGELTKNNTGFYSGTLEIDGGRTCFFTSIKVAKKEESKKVIDTKSLLTGKIPIGTAFKILEVPYDDSYYSSKKEIEGKTGFTTNEMTLDENGYTGGNIKTADGTSYNFYRVQLGKNGSSSTSTSLSSSSKTPTKSTTSTTSSTNKSVKFVTGIIKKGTSVYVAEISSDDSYYGDRFDKIGKRGKVSKEDMDMKDDGYYTGDFLYDDGSTAYFYKAKFSKEPVATLLKLPNNKSTTPKSTSTDYSDLSYLFGASGDDWTDAQQDKDIKNGDKVEITAINEDDSYYSDKDDYIGKKGVAQDDIKFIYDDGGYSGNVKLEDGTKSHFYLVKLKKVASTTTSSSSSTKSLTSTTSTTLPASIAKNTKVVVVDIGSEDSFYSSKNTYIGKTGKVAEGLIFQTGGYYSGKILFDDGTDAYFFNAKLTVLK